MKTFVTAYSPGFSGGEISPRLRGRSDLNFYPRSLQRARNFLIAKQGPAFRRSGTRYVAEAKSSAAKSRLVRFAVSDSVQYSLEFANAVIRVYKMVNGVGQRVGTFEITSPYATADLAALRFSQSADVLWITHPSYQPRTLKRIGTDDTLLASWDLAVFQHEDGPWEPINITATTVTYAGTLTKGGVGTITFSAPILKGTSEDVGREVRIKTAAKSWGSVRITAHTSTTVATVVVVREIGAAVATANWQLGIFRPGNWPYVSTIHQGRFAFAATNTQPQSIWLSKVDDYPVFSPTDPSNGGTEDIVADSSALALTIDDDSMNFIRWLRSDRTGLAIMTEGGVFILNAPNDGALTPTSRVMRRHSGFGCSPACEPQRAGISLLMWQQTRKLRELAYRLESDRVDGGDIASRAENLTFSGLEETAYGELPDSILWTRVGTGQLLALTLERDEQVAAWSVQTFFNPPTTTADRALTTQTQAEVESICIVRHQSRDWLWMIVKRTINSATFRSIEVLQPNFDHNTPHSDAWMLDCATQYKGVASGTVTAAHLPNTVVGAAATPDDEGLATLPLIGTNGSGVATLPFNATTAIIGIPYKATLRSLPVIPDAPYDSRGKQQRVTMMTMQLWRSLGGFVGDEETKVEIVNRTPSMPQDTSPALLTGFYQATVSQRMTREPYWEIDTIDPQPFTLLSVAAEVNVGGA